MAIQFSKLRDPRLALTDKITFGKLRDCRVCDCIQDHYEYLIWAEKAGYIKFQPIVVETIKEHAGFKNQQRHQLEEVDPYTKEYDEPSVQEVNFSDDDIPF
jgi:hypothetical protein